MTNLSELLVKHKADGDRYAAPLGEFIKKQRPEIVVETGYGVSTLFILDALDANKKGMLYSVDPKPWFADRIEHPRLELIEKKSFDALADLYLRIPEPLDLFLHDSNHDVECMTFELEFGFACLSPGGWIACDDYVWGGHNAWYKFLSKYMLADVKLGSLALAQKTNHHVKIPMDLVRNYNAVCRQIASDAKETRLAAGFEVDSAAFKE